MILTEKQLAEINERERANREWNAVISSDIGWRLRQQCADTKALLFDLEKANAEAEKYCKQALAWQSNCEERGREIERLRDGLEKLRLWAIAYPLAVFPEPDWKKARTALASANMTLDAISASNMRHVIEGVMEILQEALKEGKP